ncbi:MAG: class I SAM-dependent methyltransferase, partial [Candidatus Staskawiczbacteria bacterium]|nr:class I SAM-dependent methyltransferase [Candidatus Staskawiczbacteria bacterium]
LTPTAKYYGLDISLGTLKQCKKNCKRWNRDINLVHGVAEQLPFRDNSFDVVFHISGISFFGDRKQAMLEMIRVAIKLFISMNS